MSEQFSNKTEKEIKSYWEVNGIPEKIRSKKSTKNYYFVDGPPYASGHLHLGTAMNRILKDLIIRYRRMSGYNVLDIPGFDTHGVPIEAKVQKAYGLKSKEDIEKFGIDKFTIECKKFATEHIDDMSKEIYNLGQWMDWVNPYRTLDKSYMETAWWVFKKATEKGLLYHDKYPVHVCPTCETAVSFNEIEHQDLVDNSIYVKLKSVDDPNTYFVVWTTTPWTLPANLGIMVHPGFKYVELIHEDTKYIVAEELVSKLVKEFGWQDYSLGKIFLGKELEGKKYEPILGECLENIEELKKDSYKVILSARFVNLEDGSGLVHCAPGHGREDYQVGKENGLSAYCPVTIVGVYDKTINWHSGEKVKSLDPKIIEYLEEKGAILGKKSIKHSYPVCWRCSSPLLQVALPQWFLRIEPMRERLKEINKEEVTWYPEWAKERFDNWLDSISDWPISRARYWGTPIPIWQCDNCKEIEVFGSLEELKVKAPSVDLEMDLHKPGIDHITYNCKCGGTMKRILEIFDVWFDSGIASFASLGYPKKQELFNQFWPPDINLEGSDQIRGWWNSQMIVSAICFDKSPYKFVALHGMVLAVDKRKLSKSLGNDKPLSERFSELSIDYYRYYFAREYNGMDVVIDEKKFLDIKRVFNLLENIYSLMSLMDDNLRFNPSSENDKLEVEDKWILSKYNSLVESYHKNYQGCNFSKATTDIEKFILEDFSRTYIKLIKKRENKNNVLNHIFSGLLLLLSPAAPHLTEYLYLKFKDKKETIHLEELPVANLKLIDKNLEENFTVALDIVQETLAARERTKKRLRWILPRLVVVTAEANKLEGIKEIVSNMANVKVVLLQEDVPKGNYEEGKVSETLSIYLDLDIPKGLEEEWELSELTRAIQSERKKNNLTPSQVVSLNIACSDIAFIESNKAAIETGTSTKLSVVPFDASNTSKQKLIEREVYFSFSF
ncbi:MAG: isoleucine--tRNA ligase [archaeon]|jgi:isoleucyl-tRNA synthetase